MKRVLLVGSSGAIGRRYKAILNYLNVDVLECDPESGTGDNIFNKTDGVLVASPTTTHRSILEYVLKHDVPVLCEKPLCASLEECYHAIHLPNAKRRLYMVDNWVHMLGGFRKNYVIKYRNWYMGKESFAFNMAQPIYLTSLGKLQVNKNYPMFEAHVDDKIYTAYEIEKSYVEMIEKWISTGKSHFGVTEAVEMQSCLDEYA